MVNDIVSDTLIRIKNSYAAGKKEVMVPRSRLGLELCKLLSKEGYLASVEPKDQGIKVELKYRNDFPALTDLRRVSKPSLRIYVGKNEIPVVLGGKGLSVISTPQGLMAGREAHKKGLGGEVICKVW